MVDLSYSNRAVSAAVPQTWNNLPVAFTDIVTNCLTTSLSLSLVICPFTVLLTVLSLYFQLLSVHDQFLARLVFTFIKCCAMSAAVQCFINLSLGFDRFHTV